MGGYAELLQWGPVAHYLRLPFQTQVSVAGIVLLTLIFHARFNFKTFAYAPTILTTTGIFFTFLGVALGLSEFDTNNIQASVPTLLGGLKTAFWASVAGVGGALTIKFRHFAFGLREEQGLKSTDEEVTGHDLAKLLASIQHALVGQDDATLISQIKLLRQDTNDRLDSLKKAQLDALQRLSEMGSKALVEALRDVIADFNSKLTEQFGENFKHLNQAVEKLVSWQDHYKTFVDEITSKLLDVIDSMATASNSYSSLVNEASRFSKVSADLSALLSGLETQKQQLTGTLKQLADLLLAASGSLPQIETKVLELTTQLSTAVKQNQQEVSKAVAENSLLLRTSMRDAAEQIRTGLTEHHAELRKFLSENAVQVRNSFQTVNAEFTKVNQEFNKQIGDLTAKTKEQVAALDAALAEELKKSLESLGRQLAALSEKFVSDYEPLTEKLAKVVRLAEAA
jgi:hypothetical protein